MSLFLFVVLAISFNETKQDLSSLPSQTADVKQNCLSSQTSFRGCLRKLTLIKGPQVQSYDFSTAFHLQGVSPHSCPGTESWTLGELLSWELSSLFWGELFCESKSLQFGVHCQLRLSVSREKCCVYVKLKPCVQQIPLLNSLKCKLNPLALFLFFIFCLFVFFSFPGPHPQHMEVPRLGV